MLTRQVTCGLAPDFTRPLKRKATARLCDSPCVSRPREGCKGAWRVAAPRCTEPAQSQDARPRCTAGGKACVRNSASLSSTALETSSKLAESSTGDLCAAHNQDVMSSMSRNSFIYHQVVGKSCTSGPANVDNATVAGSSNELTWHTSIAKLA